MEEEKRVVVGVAWKLQIEENMKTTNRDSSSRSGNNNNNNISSRDSARL